MISTDLRFRGHMGNLNTNIVEIDLAAEAYVTGGIDIPNVRLGLSAPLAVNPMPAGGYIFEYDYAAKKLKAFPAVVKPFVTHTGIDIKGADSTDSENTDIDSAPTNDEGIASYSAVGPIAQVITLTVTAGAETSGDITITLDEVESKVTVSEEDDAEAVAGKIRLASIDGWTISGEGEVAIFTADVEGANGEFSFDGGETGVTATMVETTAGEDSAWTVGTIANPDVARNVCIVLKAVGDTLDLYDGVMSFTVTGTFGGSEVTDAITFESDETNVTVAENKFRVKYGEQPFDKITDVTLDNLPENGIQIAVGLGSKIGLPGGIEEIIKASLNGSDFDYDEKIGEGTINFGDIADNTDFTVIYKPSSGFAGIDNGLIEVSAGTPITATIRCIAIGI